jgi:uncharacterized protein (TIGR02145 family)
MILSTSGGQLQTDNGIIEKYCYNNDESNCAILGGLYEWREAMQYVTNEGTKGICPIGWHLPTYSELKNLDITAEGDGNALKKIGQGWDNGSGTNKSGFSILLSGNRGPIDGAFRDLWSQPYFWTSTGEENDVATAMSMNATNSQISYIAPNKNNGFTIRCLKD